MTTGANDARRAGSVVSAVLGQVGLLPFDLPIPAHNSIGEYTR